MSPTFPAQLGDYADVGALQLSVVNSEREPRTLPRSRGLYPISLIAVMAVSEFAIKSSLGPRANRLRRPAQQFAACGAGEGNGDRLGAAEGGAERAPGGKAMWRVSAAALAIVRLDGHWPAISGVRETEFCG